MSNTFQVRLPGNAVPGQTLETPVPSGYPQAGTMVKFKVPAGVSGGSVISVPLPASNQVQPTAPPTAQYSTAQYPAVQYPNATSPSPVTVIQQPLPPPVTVVQQPIAPPVTVVSRGGYPYGGGAYYGGVGAELALEREMIRERRMERAIIGAEVAAIEASAFNDPFMYGGGVGGAIVGSEIGAIEGAAIGGALGGGIGAMEGAIIGSEIGAIEGAQNFW